MPRYPDHGIGTQAVSRTKLYEQVWTMPASQLALHYGLSDVGLAKVCKQYRIPRPPRGYWAKLRAGKPVKRTPLPDVNDASYETVYMKGWAMPEKAIQTAITSKDEGHSYDQGESANALHPLAMDARDQLRSAQPDHDGLVKTDPTTTLNIHVSPACVDRAVAAFDRFIHLWAERAGEVRIEAETRSGATTVAIGVDVLYLRLAEHLDEQKPLSDPDRRIGELCFWIEGDPRREFRRRWSDTKSQRIERLTKPMIETLLHVLEVKKNVRLDHECEQRQKQRVKEKRQAQAQQDSRAFQWQQELRQRVDRWHEAKRIREYLAAMQSAIDNERLQPIDEKGFQAWFTWAQRYADSTDPLTDPGPQQHDPEPPPNTSVEQLDLTSATRAAVDASDAADTDALWKMTEDEVRAVSDRNFGAVWNELTRVLEALGYDVSKRQSRSHWW